MFSQDDDSTGVALGVVLGLIVLVISLVIGIAVHRGGAGSAPKAVAAPAAAATAEADEADEASVKVENGVVKFYFASAKADLAAGANEALAEVVKAVAEGKTVVISGFHDATGDAEKNAELAKQRALAVRDALKGLGVPEDKVELKKPEQLTGSGGNAEARRVEVVAQ